MRLTVLGLKRLDFKDDDGREIKGVSVHGHYYDPDMVGQCTKPVFLSDRALKGLDFPMEEENFESFIGESLEMEFNNKGKAIGIEFAKT